MNSTLAHGERMDNPELISAAYWSGLLTSIENWAFLVVVVALAIEFVAGRFAAPFKEKLEGAKDLKIAELNNETAGLRAREPLVIDALKSARDVTTALGVTTNFLMTLSQELIRVANPGIMIPGALSIEQNAQIVSSTKHFAGTLFDAEIDIISSDAERVMLAGAIIAVLGEAGWVKVSRTEPQQSRDNAQGILVTSNDTGLLDAARALASALNAAGIDAVVNPEIETDTTTIKMIRILVGPKAR
jgi:hypothetical protein